MTPARRAFTVVVLLPALLAPQAVMDVCLCRGVLGSLLVLDLRCGPEASCCCASRCAPPNGPAAGEHAPCTVKVRTGSTAPARTPDGADGGLPAPVSAAPADAHVFAAVETRAPRRTSEPPRPPGAAPSAFRTPLRV